MLKALYAAHSRGPATPRLVASSRLLSSQTARPGRLSFWRIRSIAFEVFGRLAERSRLVLLQPGLLLDKRCFGDVLLPLAVVRAFVTLVRDPLAFVGDAVTLVGDVIALIRDLVTLICDQLATIELDAPVGSNPLNSLDAARPSSLHSLPLPPTLLPSLSNGPCDRPRFSEA